MCECVLVNARSVCQCEEQGSMCVSCVCMCVYMYECMNERVSL